MVFAEDSYYSRPKDIYSINGNDDYAGQRIINNPRNHEDFDFAIESSELERHFKKFGLCIDISEWINNFIMDIDLDFFKTCAAICPKDAAFFLMLIRKCKAISIAKESIWIRQWREDNDQNLTVAFLLERLLALIHEATAN